MINAQFRPIEQWPGERTHAYKRQGASRFKASYSTTLDTLERELAQLRATDIVIELFVGFADIRNDGWPRSTARPSDPGVIVSFGSKHGPLRYFTDVFGNWQANLRAIALGLEALRKVDRYGIGKRGEQYTGWSALPPCAIPADAVPMSVDEAIAFMHEHADADISWDYDDPDGVAAAYRSAAKRLHPDVGGSTEMFKALEEAKRILTEEPS